MKNKLSSLSHSKSFRKTISKFNLSCIDPGKVTQILKSEKHKKSLTEFLSQALR